MTGSGMGVGDGGTLVAVGGGGGVLVGNSGAVVAVAVGVGGPTTWMVWLATLVLMR